jgi:hypothetical protein
MYFAIRFLSSFRAIFGWTRIDGGLTSSRWFQGSNYANSFQSKPGYPRSAQKQGRLSSLSLRRCISAKLPNPPAGLTIHYAQDILCSRDSIAVQVSEYWHIEKSPVEFNQTIPPSLDLLPMIALLLATGQEDGWQSQSLGEILARRIFRYAANGELCPSSPHIQTCTYWMTRFQSHVGLRE